jgi:hypothetical protein
LVDTVSEWKLAHPHWFSALQGELVPLALRVSRLSLLLFLVIGQKDIYKATPSLMQ